jgi:hypothetical protein
VLTDFRAASMALAEQYAPDIAPRPGTVRELLGRLSRFGVAGAVLPATADDATVLAAGAAVAPVAAGTLAEVDTVLGRLETPVGQPPTPLPANDPARHQAVQRAARTLLGGAVVLTPGLGERPDLLAALTTAPSVLPGRLEEWLLTMARVRPALATLADVRAMADVLELPAPRATVAQPGRAAGAPWLGDRWPDPEAVPGQTCNELRRHRPPEGPLIHLVLLTEDGAAAAAADAALVLDAVSEVLPSPTVTTGLAVHYDAPDARPPQTLLLAVHPDPADADRPWDVDLLAGVLDEALELALIRTVEVEDLAAVRLDEYVPAVYVREGLENLPPIAELITRWIDHVGLWQSSAVAANKTGDGA